MSVASDRDSPLRLLGGAALLAGLAWWLRFVQDDAFISFRYARNWVRGQGLVWNPGDYVEGYTNFLWTAWMGVPFALGWDPVRFSQVVGIGLFVGTLLATHRFVRNLDLRGTTARLAVLLVGTNYSFVCYATGGLETQLQALLWVGLAAVVSGGLGARGTGPGRALAISLLVALALLTRLDSLVFAGPLVALAGAAIVGPSAPTRTRGRSLALLLAPAAAILGAWLVWKLGYYGELLPNTWYAKMSSARLPVLVRGLYYVAVFFVTYLLLPLVVVHLARLPWLLSRVGLPRLLLLDAPIALWLAYVVFVGGDFMEFRFLVPALPAIFVALAWTITEGIARPRWRVASLALVLAGSALHALTFDTSPLKRGFESIPALRRHIEGPRGWTAIGRELGQLLGPEHDVLIAVAPAGAIPYFSELRSVDMLGLNDAWIARHGAFLSDRAGHKRIATIAHLRDRGVHLVIGHPIVLPPADSPSASFPAKRLDTLFVHQSVPDPESLDDQTRMAMLPVGSAGELVAIYLTPHPRIEALAASGALRLVHLARDAQGAAATGSSSTASAGTSTEKASRRTSERKPR